MEMGRKKDLMRFSGRTGGYNLQQVFRTKVKRKCLEMILGFEPEMMLELCVNVLGKKNHKIHNKRLGRK